MDSLDAFIQQLPQIVPESWCFDCRICCRFPDPEKAQTPVWSGREAAWVNELDRRSPTPLRLNPISGLPVFTSQLNPCSHSEGFHCSAFEESSKKCLIHSIKPLDCRLYPFVMTRHPSGSAPVLVIDMKCPYIQASMKESAMAAYIHGLVDYLEQPVAGDYFRSNPGIVGAWWPEYLPVAWIQSAAAALPLPPIAVPEGLQPVLNSDLPFIRKAEAKFGNKNLSNGTVDAWIPWSDLIGLYWMQKSNTLFLFARQAGGFFMPFPPLAETLSAPLLDEAWTELNRLNAGNAVSRIEGVSEQKKSLFEEAGFFLRASEPDYCYLRSDLADLSGDRYHSQRSMINQASKTIGEYRFRPLTPDDFNSCAELYWRWAADFYLNHPDQDEAHRMIRDSFFFHQSLLKASCANGWVSYGLEAGGKLLGYTIGRPLSDELFCVYAEMTDKTVPGLSALIFREFCRTQNQFTWINTMGDSGLKGLKQSKESYRPARMIPCWVAEKK